MAEKLPRGIRRRGDSFQIDVTVAGKRVTRTAQTLDQAKAIQADIRAKLLNTGLAEEPCDGCWTLGQAIDYTLRYVWCNCRPSSIEKIKINCRQLVEFFGRDCNLENLRTADVDQFIKHLTATDSGATINRKTSALSKLFTVGIEREKLTRRPKIQRQRESEHRIRFLTDIEEQGCIAALQQWGLTNDLDAFEVLIDTGLRPGELWELTPNKLDMMSASGRGAIVLAAADTKTHSPRVVVLTKRARAILARRLLTCGRGQLIPGMNNYRFNRTFDKLAALLNLEHDKQFIPYVLRHTCCTRLVRSGAPLKFVKDWMGHKSIVTTMRYAHFAPTDMANLATPLEDRKRELETQETVPLRNIS